CAGVGSRLVHCAQPSRLLLVTRIPRPPRPTLFPYTTLFRSMAGAAAVAAGIGLFGLVFAGVSMTAVQISEYSAAASGLAGGILRSEEHTSELQSRFDLVCRLLLEKKKDTKST